MFGRDDFRKELAIGHYVSREVQEQAKVNINKNFDYMKKMGRSWENERLVIEDDTY